MKLLVTNQVFDRFWKTPINSWPQLKAFAATGFAAETGLSSETLDLYNSSEAAACERALSQQAVHEWSQTKIDTVNDYLRLHTGAVFLETLPDAGYPNKVSLIDAARPLTMALEVGKAISDIVDGLGQLITGDFTYSPEKISQAAKALKDWVPGIRTESVVGFFGSLVALRPETRVTLTRDLQAAIGDAAALTAAPHQESKPN